ncbi:MAG: choice-of-anchor Q domain-containing protein [Caldilineaceae bacterium]
MHIKMNWLFLRSVRRRYSRCKAHWLALFVWLVALCPVTPVFAARHAPHTPADTVVTNCSNDTQLNQAVTAAGTTTITFSCGAGLHTIPISTAMQVAGEVTIDGGGQIALDGGKLAAFFQVFSGHKLELRNLTLQNGKFNGVHPLENFGELVLTNVLVQNNQTTGQGGAVANYHTLVVRDSIFMSNVAISTNAITGSGGALYTDGGAATVENSTFTNNHIQGTVGVGGAISVQSGQTTITGSTFNGNNALDGGGLYVNSGATVTVTQSTFISNTAGYGGAIENQGQLQVKFSTLRQNKANNDGGAIWVLNGNLGLAYSTVANNRAGTLGGGISCYANTLSVGYSTISGNSASGSNGVGGGGIYSTCNLTVMNTTISGNAATGNGGGAIYQKSSGNATVAATTIAGNTAAFGAGVYNDGAGASTLSLHYTMLANNVTGNCDGVITSLGYNLADDSNCAALTQPGDQKNINLPLGPLANNGGTTLTHLPLTGNPALDAIPTPCSFTDDQRGIARPQNGKCDIGAVEVTAVQFAYLPLLMK